MTIGNENMQPSFSIIIPTFIRPGQLTTCLRSLVALCYPRDRFEVIVVDDESAVSPEAIVAPFCQHLNLTLLIQPHAGPAAARNTGARQAKGEFLAFTDDDCLPAPDWLHALAKRFATTPDCIIGGQTLNALSGNPFSTASQTLIDYLYTYYNADSNHARFVASNNLAVSANRFHALNGFDTTFRLPGGEDREFCDRWLHHGYQIIYAPEVMVYHAHSLTFRTFWKQHVNYGRGSFHFHGRRDQSDRRRLEPKWFYLDLLHYPFVQRRNRQALLLVALLVMSQVATATGFFRHLVHRTWSRNGGLAQ